MKRPYSTEWTPPRLDSLSDEILDRNLDAAVLRVQQMHMALGVAQADRQALYNEREKRDEARGIVRPGAPCRTCGACHRCYLGNHGSCHGCPCRCGEDGSVVPERGCQHGPSARGSS